MHSAMSELLNRVGENVQRRQLFRRRQSILVAVSGGLDSIVLLHIVSDLARKNEWQLFVAHLNHQLRGRNSQADERLVRQIADRLDLPAVVERADVRTFASKHRLSLEMAGRTLRHDFLARMAAEMGIPSVALAHHADDQLELFFLRLLRGSGGEGSAGMKWRNPSPSNPEIELVRPLLDQPKAALREYAAQNKLRFRNDASNSCLDIQRNRIRHELLPLLRKRYQPGLDRTILRMMDIIGAEAELVAVLARDWLERQRSRIGFHSFPKSEGQTPFEDLPLAVQRRCIQLQLLGQGIAVDYDLVEQLRLGPEKAVTVGQGKASRGGEGEPPRRGRGARARGVTQVLLSALRDTKGIIHLRQSKPAEFNSNSKAVDLGERAGEVVFDGVRIRWRIELRNGNGQREAVARRQFFDASKVGSRILLRHWQPGDRFQPIGMAHAVKLQDFFTNEKVPRSRRHDLIVAATAQGEVFWVEGMRISERFKLTKPVNRRLQWRWHRL